MMQIQILLILVVFLCMEVFIICVLNGIETKLKNLSAKFTILENQLRRVAKW